MSPSVVKEFSGYVLPPYLMREFMMIIFTGGVISSFFGSYLILTDDGVSKGWIPLVLIMGMIEAAALYGTVMKLEKFLSSRIVLQIIGILINTVLILILVFRPEAIQPVEENKFDTFLLSTRQKYNSILPEVSGFVAHFLELVTASNKINYYLSISGAILIFVLQCFLYILIRIHYSNIQRERRKKKKLIHADVIHKP